MHSTELPQRKQQKRKKKKEKKKDGKTRSCFCFVFCKESLRASYDNTDTRKNHCVSYVLHLHGLGTQPDFE